MSAKERDMSVSGNDGVTNQGLDRDTHGLDRDATTEAGSAPMGRQTGTGVMDNATAPHTDAISGDRVRDGDVQATRQDGTLISGHLDDIDTGSIHRSTPS